jgi:hypothetical protein
MGHRVNRQQLDPALLQMLREPKKFQVPVGITDKDSLLVIVKSTAKMLKVAKQKSQRSLDVVERETQKNRRNQRKRANAGSTKGGRDECRTGGLRSPIYY